jgi:hypothetical protein
MPLQVNTIHAVLLDMKERLLKVQQAVMQQLHQYRHLTVPLEAQESNSDAEGENETSAAAEARPTLNLVDVGTGAARRDSRRLLEETTAESDILKTEEAGDTCKHENEEDSPATEEPIALQRPSLAGDEVCPHSVPLDSASVDVSAQESPSLGDSNVKQLVKNDSTSG